ncbi:DUF6233 domain-containing protein [Streptomyces sp. NPDC087532]|uniref:DUF6233 domain-containing protein n=1 Tax=Streptomyces sp. NPDC087532 TaxID=3365795 RepID=UPI0037F4E38F
MTSPGAFVPVPVLVVLPDGQELVARLYARVQTPVGGWEYDVGMPSYRNPGAGGVEAAEYRVWVEAPAMVRPVDGVDYSSVPATPLPPPSVISEILGKRRPSGWVLQRIGTGQGVVHAVDCGEAPKDAPTLGWERALEVAEQPGVRLCSLCGTAAELDPLLRGFEAGFGDGW